jgi:hypothetical protein
VDNFRKRCTKCNSETKHYNNVRHFVCPNPTCNAEGLDAFVGVFVQDQPESGEIIRHNHTLNGD